MTQGIDYSMGEPTQQALNNGGIKFACRYTGFTSPGLSQSKILTLSEAKDLSSKGISIVSNWEWYADRPERGFYAGVWDAQTAITYHTNAGGPPDAPIYFSVDYAPSSFTNVDAYFRGIASVLPLNRIGAYGSFYTISHLHNSGLITWCWQTYAWSNGWWYIHNNIEQYLNGTTLSDGTVVDLDKAFPDSNGYFGQWILDPPIGANKFMDQQFNDVWYANGVPAGYKSGIYQVMLAGFNAQKFTACFPTSAEINTVDWQGNKLLYQTMSNGHHCEYANGTGRVYNPQGSMVWSSTI